MRSSGTSAVTACGFVGLLALTCISVVGGPPETKATSGWPQFLGPNRNGISTETGLMKSWPSGGPKVVWRAPGGVGMSAVVVADGGAFTVIQRDEQEVAIRLNAKTGKEVWGTPVAPAYENGQGDGTRATPTVADGKLFVFTGQGVLAALDIKTGELAWKEDLVREVKGRVADYGMASSPLIVGKNVVVTVGAAGASVVACDQKTGKIAWKSGSDPAGYSSAALLDIAGGQQVVVFNGKGVVGLAPETGKELWQYPFPTDFDCNIATPIAYKGDVFISAGENHGCAMLDVEKTGTKYRVEEVWTSTGTKSVMRNGWQTCILLDGYLYGYDNVGAAGPIMHLTCLNAADGKVVWQKTRFGKGNCIAADGKLFCTNMEGEFIVVRATTEGYEEFGRMPVLEPGSRQAPALAGGLMYIRDDNEIVCLDASE